MNKKLLLGLFLLLGCSALVQQTTSAHVLISDETKAIGAVLHIVPDDDPIAGEQASLFFDIQTQLLDRDSASLTVANTTTDEVVDVPVTLSETSVMAEYVFPTQGVYSVSLVVSSGKTYTFNYSQRVSRGVIGSALDKPTYPLANLALVFCGTLFLLLLISVFNHRKEIKTHSTF